METKKFKLLTLQLVILLVYHLLEKAFRTSIWSVAKIFYDAKTTEITKPFEIE